ncbi:MAG: DUF4382 domain-containing protein [bacterium]
MNDLTKKIIQSVSGLFVFAIIPFIVGCSDSTSTENGQGQIKITMVDNPAEYEEVNVVVVRVEVHKAGADSNSNWVVLNNTETTYNLLKLRNGASAIIGTNSLESGHYTQIRLILGTGNTIVVNGVRFGLDVSSVSETGIKLNHEFDIQTGSLYELVLDFDVQHSIIFTGNERYKLSPVIRVVPLLKAGTISGKVLPIDAYASVDAINVKITISTIADILTGSFKLMAVEDGTYDVKITSKNPAYRDTTFINVYVAAKQNTNLGSIILNLK